MDIDNPSAGFAGPALPLGFDKLVDAEFPDLVKIIDHAHAVLLPVPIVELPKFFAGKLSACMIVPVMNPAHEKMTQFF
jgi:hypothetical protein